MKELLFLSEPLLRREPAEEEGGGAGGLGGGSPLAQRTALPSPVSMRSALPYFCVFLAMVPMLDMWWRSVWECDESDE